MVSLLHCTTIYDCLDCIVHVHVVKFAVLEHMSKIGPIVLTVYYGSRSYIEVAVPTLHSCRHEMENSVSEVCTWPITQTNS